MLGTLDLMKLSLPYILKFGVKVNKKVTTENRHISAQP